MTGRRIARVLIDSPLPQLDRLFDYAIPDELATAAVPGVRVRVPLRTAGRVVDGYIVETVEADDSGEVEDSPPRPLSELDAVVSSVAVLPARLYALARRVADRAAGSASDILRLAIPKRMVRVEKAWCAGDPPSAAPVTAAAAAWARAELQDFPGLADALTDGRRIAVDAPPVPVELPSGETTGRWATLLAAAAAHVLAAGRSVVVVVPDHRDLDSVAAALEGLIPASALVRDDADQSGPARYGAYLRRLADAPCVVIGNRSAVYAPVHDLGLVAIWDDGDPLLAEPLSPGVHARDAALVRQELDGGALLLLGHTRTTDVERLVTVGWVRDLAARRRVSPRVVLSPPDARGARIPSAAWAAARSALADGPVLVQVARPGYAPALVCADCRRPARCPHCTGPLRARRPGATPECAWCGRAATGWTCGNCGSDKVRMASSGSERTADELGRAFPGVRIVVADGAHAVLRVDARPALVIATRGAEPIADGGYRAVLLLDGERMLMSEDLRIGESCLRWWSNAAALARPGAPVHLAGVVGPVARALATWSQPAYARGELAERAPLRMPPAVRVAAIEGVPTAVASALSTLREAVPALPEDAVVGPVAVGDDSAVHRALVRFEYAQGRAVAESLRASVVHAALTSRRSAHERGPRARNTLKVRLDVLEPEL
ncbi:primosomal protein N' [Microbacterium rhizosphaerae]|uniref:Probable replication restart protein PriA n=1 Tax=Microbacterium rhizosphaerae TaxID=1678237 RepID=A0ABZ0SGV2_9MICO|nr:primosomal protein N' [Microbacterium rhizosphaerae]WPR88058.1 primosomal protein N' [Microbacterium rhizosphaerae]